MVVPLPQMRPSRPASPPLLQAGSDLPALFSEAGFFPQIPSLQVWVVATGLFWEAQVGVRYREGSGLAVPLSLPECATKHGDIWGQMPPQQVSQTPKDISGKQRGLCGRWRELVTQPHLEEGLVRQRSRGQCEVWLSLPLGLEAFQFVLNQDEGSGIWGPWCSSVKRAGTGWAEAEGGARRGVTLPQPSFPAHWETPNAGTHLEVSLSPGPLILPVYGRAQMCSRPSMGAQVLSH